MFVCGGKKPLRADAGGATGLLSTISVHFHLKPYFVVKNNFQKMVFTLAKARVRVRAHARAIVGSYYYTEVQLADLPPTSRLASY